MKDRLPPRPASSSAAAAPLSGRSADRRGGNDRRKIDIPSPVGVERRRYLEPRQPEVAELEITPSQWDELNQ